MQLDNLASHRGLCSKYSLRSFKYTLSSFARLAERFAMCVFCTLVFGFRIGASRRSAGPSCSAAWPSRDDETVAVAVGVDVAV